MQQIRKVLVRKNAEIDVLFLYSKTWLNQTLAEKLTVNQDSYKVMKSMEKSLVIFQSSNVWKKFFSLI